MKTRGQITLASSEILYRFETRMTLSIFTSYMEVVQVNLSKNDCFLQLGNCYYL